MALHQAPTDSAQRQDSGLITAISNGTLIKWNPHDRSKMTRTTIEPLILIVEDEADIVTLVAYNLEHPASQRTQIRCSILLI